MIEFGESRPTLYIFPTVGLQWAGNACMCFGISSIGLDFQMPQARHGKKYNVAYCDGHASGVDVHSLFSSTNNARSWNNDHEPHPETWLPP